ncbi:MAG TPA: TlpA disulfide reductase family protein [Gemmatimonadaceae bacterium]|nr:TlpA disulfide reductase family protein [Gemmatimonadaceae bacterium]
MTIRKLFPSAPFLTLLLAAASLASTPALAQDLGIEVGAQAPVVIVQSLDGKPVDLGAYIGKTPMLIEFWATWCPNCKELMPTLLDVEKKYGKKVKFVALAVAINQSPERVRRWLAANPMPHDTFYDVEGKAAGAFDAPATSYVVVLDKNGRVVYTGLGGKQDLEAALKKAL